MKAKHILTFKLILVLFFMAGGSYLLFGKVGVIAGVCETIIIVGCIDKDFSDSVFKEGIKILIVEFFIIAMALLANINYFGLGISALIVGLVINYLYIYHKKMPRTMGFLYLFMFLTYLKVPVQAYADLIGAIVIGSLFIIIIYYLLTRKMYFTGVKKDIVKQNLEDIDFKNFKSFKFRFIILSAILFAVSIIVMRYFYAVHGLWLVITVLVVMQPDKATSMKKIIHRIIGTIVGAGVFLVVLSFNYGDFKYMIDILFIISLYFMLYPMKHYAFQAVFITFFALSIDSVFYSTQSHMFLGEYRIMFTLIGCILILGLFVAERGIEKIYNHHKFVK